MVCSQIEYLINYLLFRLIYFLNFQLILLKKTLKIIQNSYEIDGGYECTPLSRVTW